MASGPVKRIDVVDWKNVQCHSAKHNCLYLMNGIATFGRAGEWVGNKLRS